jgi:2-octaprenyl-6-methoxyphenol hydroxylase
MSQKSTEILIAGGGLVGNALAIALAQSAIAVSVVDPLPRAKQLDDSFDGRTSAIAQGSVRILERIGAWQHIAPHVQPIHDIRVCEAEKPGFVHYSDAEVGEPFGYIVENAILRKGLFLALEATPGITRVESSVKSYAVIDQRAVGTLENGDTVSASLLIAADGRFSGLRPQAGIDARVIGYDQTAIVCVIEHEMPHHGLALEKFYPVGPFAALPLKPKDGVNRSGIVWTESERNAPNYLALSDNEFNSELQRRLGPADACVWGEAKAVGKRFSYPLKLMHAERFIAERFALVGDSAHGIHPIAGQGVNLGYRDVAVIAQLLAEQKALGLDLGSATMLERYQRWRKFDSVSMTASTDLLNRLFSNNLPGMSLVRRVGLSAVNRMPRLKQVFMRHAMGLIGDLPKLMEPPKAA